MELIEMCTILFYTTYLHHAFQSVTQVNVQTE